MFGALFQKSDVSSGNRGGSRPQVVDGSLANSLESLLTTRVERIRLHDFFRCRDQFREWSPVPPMASASVFDTNYICARQLPCREINKLLMLSIEV